MGNQRFHNAESLYHFIKLNCFIHRDPVNVELAAKIKQTSDGPTLKGIVKEAVIDNSTWDNLKAETMFHIDILKFKQHQDLAKLLIETGHRPLIENVVDKDRFWGISGRNCAGNSFMGCRRQLTVGDVMPPVMLLSDSALQNWNVPQDSIRLISCSAMTFDVVRSLSPIFIENVQTGLGFLVGACNIFVHEFQPFPANKV